MLFFCTSFTKESRKIKCILIFIYEAAQLFSASIIIRNVSWAYRNQQISILEWFLKDHVTLKTGKIILKIQLYITGINYILKYIHIDIKQIFLLQYHFTILLCLLYFWSNKCRLGEQKRHEQIFQTLDKLVRSSVSASLCWRLSI